jgi:hypothetical protein
LDTANREDRYIRRPMACPPAQENTALRCTEENMPNFRNRRPSSGGSNPGLTPIDDIHGASTSRDMEPSSTTGRISAQDDDSEHKTKGRRSSTKKDTPKNA